MAGMSNWGCVLRNRSGRPGIPCPPATCCEWLNPGWLWAWSGMTVSGRHRLLGSLSQHRWPGPPGSDFEDTNLRELRVLKSLEVAWNPYGPPLRVPCHPTLGLGVGVGWVVEKGLNDTRSAPGTRKTGKDRPQNCRPQSTHTPLWPLFALFF